MKMLFCLVHLIFSSSYLFRVCVMFWHNRDDLSLPEVESGLVPRLEVGQRLHVVELAGVGLGQVAVQQVLDLGWKTQRILVRLRGNTYEKHSRLILRHELNNAFVFI